MFRCMLPATRVVALALLALIVASIHPTRGEREVVDPHRGSDVTRERFIFIEGAFEELTRYAGRRAR